jgi:hypothetical protein
MPREDIKTGKNLAKQIIWRRTYAIHPKTAWSWREAMCRL